MLIFFTLKSWLAMIWFSRWWDEKWRMFRIAHQAVQFPHSVCTCIEYIWYVTVISNILKYAHWHYLHHVCVCFSTCCFKIFPLHDQINLCHCATFRSGIYRSLCYVYLICVYTGMNYKVNNCLFNLFVFGYIWLLLWLFTDYISNSL